MHKKRQGGTARKIYKTESRAIRHVPEVVETKCEILNCELQDVASSVGAAWDISVIGPFGHPEPHYAHVLDPGTGERVCRQIGWIRKTDAQIQTAVVEISVQIGITPTDSDAIEELTFNLDALISELQAIREGISASNVLDDVDD